MIQILLVKRNPPITSTHCIIFWSANFYLSLQCFFIIFYREIYIYFLYMFIVNKIFHFVFSLINPCIYIFCIFSHFCLKNRLCSYNLIFEFLELVKTTYKSVFRYYCDTVQLVNHYDKHWLYCKMKLSLIL